VVEAEEDNTRQAVVGVEEVVALFGQQSPEKAINQYLLEEEVVVVGAMVEAAVVLQQGVEVLEVLSAVVK
jgi:hypothetical protein